MDISAAFMHAAADEDIYVKNTPKLCYDRLEAAIHGTRKASPQWQDFFSWKRERNEL